MTILLIIYLVSIPIFWAAAIYNRWYGFCDGKGYRALAWPLYMIGIFIWGTLDYIEDWITDKATERRERQKIREAAGEK
jgi:hypothetical protein